MKHAGWGWSGIDTPGDRVLRLAVLFVGLPLLLTFALFWWRALDTAAPAPVASVARWIEPLADVRFDTAGFAALARRGPDLSAARWTPASLPDAMPSALISGDGAAAARVWVRALYTPPEGRTASEQLAIYATRVMGGAWSVWLDGRLVAANLEDWRMQWNEPLYLKLPPGSIAPGRTVAIDIAVPFKAGEGYAFGSLFVGDAAVLGRLAETRRFWQCVLPQASVLITLLLGLIALQYGLGDRNDRTYLRLAFAAIVWGLGNVMYLGDFLDDDASLWLGTLVNAATSWLVPAITLFVTPFDRERWPRLEVGTVVYAAAATVLTLPVWPWASGAAALQYYANALLGVAILGLFTWRAFSGGGRDARIIMAAVSVLPLMALRTAYCITTQHAPDAIDLYPYSAFLVFGAFLYVMQRRYLITRQALEDSNLTLDRRLRQRETELAEQHRRLMSIEQDRIVQEERQRIMRDMHDGIGTALMSSLALAERGALSPERTAALLRDALDELKMAIDSLEPIGEDLATLLASLRYRFGPRIEEAGIRIVWEMGDLPPLPWLDPSRALQVLRIVQEALTNVVKHASARSIAIGALPDADASGRATVLVTIADDGAGFDPAHARKGRGLNNLRQRAAELGASLDIRSAPGRGTVVSLRLPVEPA